MTTVRDIVITLILALCIFFAVQFTIQSCEVDGMSMEPSFYDGQRLLVVKAMYWFDEPDRGDVVIFPSRNHPEENLIKRVVGLPGETIEMRDGQVYINEEPLSEPYIASSSNGSFASIDIPYGRYFLMGDNRNHSNDSRSWGTLLGEDVIGKVWLCYWPLNDWHIIQDQLYAQE